MNLWRWLCWWLLGLCLLGCNGSGSSGFDNPAHGPVPAGPVFHPDIESTEALLLQSVLQRQTCLALNNVTLCPSDVPALTSAAPSVMTTLPQALPIVCTAQRNSTSCRFSLQFLPDALPAHAVFRLATRPVDKPNRWRLSPTPLAIGTSEVPQFEATAVVELPLSGLPPAPDGVSLYLAVLVWSTEQVPARRHVASLTESEADWVFLGVWTVHIVFATSQ